MAKNKHEPEQPVDPDDDKHVDAADEHADDEQTGYTFSPEDIVKQLPDGVVLCPTCLGMMAVVDDPPFDPRAHACDVCNGHGKLRTGSLLGQHGDRECWACHGKGFVDALQHEPDALPARAADFVEDAPPPVDVNGRTPDDPDFDWTRVRVQSPAPPPEPQPSSAEPAAAPVG